MAEYPALPLFTDAYMADTRHLTAAQHGAYLLLLMTAWRMPDCKLPDDDVFLSRCAAMDVRTWKSNRAAVMQFWHIDEQQKWFQRRLLDERKNVEERRSKNVQAGKASALKRNNRHSTSVPTKLQPESNPLNLNLLDIVDTNVSPISRKPIKHVDDLILPQWMPKELWDDFMEVRKKKKAVNSDRALKAIITQLAGFMANGHDPCKIVETSIINSWKDVYEPRENRNANQHNQPESRTTQQLRGLNEAVRIFKERSGQAQKPHDTREAGRNTADAGQNNAALLDWKP